MIHWAAGFDMKETTYRNRRAAAIESDALVVTVLQEGGHISAITDKATGVNPLWTPPWPSIEPSTYNPADHPEYGRNAESRLLAGIMGHNICLDIFGPPSAEEAAAGLDVHGEAPTAPYLFALDGDTLVCRADLQEAGLSFTRRLRIQGHTVHIHETVENVTATDHPTGWTEHVTLGPPFLEKGKTQFRVSGGRSKVFEGEFAPPDRGMQQPGAEFQWPRVPLRDGGWDDLSVYTDAPASGGFTTTLMDQGREDAFFIAWSPSAKMALGYQWRRTDFPWLGRWEENLCRDQPPWNGRTITLGMEFGASPMAETRRQMIDRGNLFGVPSYRWIPAKSKVEVAYRAALFPADVLPETLP